MITVTNVNMDKVDTKAISSILYSIAKDLAKQCENAMPKLDTDDIIKSETYKHGIYTRETNNGKYQYDFRTKEVTAL